MKMNELSEQLLVGRLETKFYLIVNAKCKAFCLNHGYNTRFWKNKIYKWPKTNETELTPTELCLIILYNAMD